ncbi:MAG: 23S rRNA (guanosine(2251)-2'-O)-methyltransferase RlmB, partial [Lachnospiraceae bacterium]|nr:23S rRNA (guanosine(2251)-2'-O)-methyltransferase RlmB [Lachnospiraceae bacterium]
MITSSSNGRIKYIMTLMQKSKFRKKEGRFIIEGTRIFEEAPVADIEEVYVNEASFDSFSKEVKDKLKKVRYELVTESVFKKISDTVTPQGILCVMKINSSDISDLIKD